MLLSASLAWSPCAWPLASSSSNIDGTRAFTLATPSEASKAKSGGAIIAVGKVLADIVRNMDPDPRNKRRSDEFITNLMDHLKAIGATDLEGTPAGFTFMVPNGKSSVRVVIDPRNISWEHADRKEEEALKLKYALIPLVMGDEKLLFAYRDEDAVKDQDWMYTRAFFKTVDQVTVDEVMHLTLEVDTLRPDFYPRPLSELVESLGRSPVPTTWRGPARTLNAFLLAIGLSAFAMAGPLEAQVPGQRVLPASMAVAAGPQRPIALGQYEIMFQREGDEMVVYARKPGEVGKGKRITGFEELDWKEMREVSLEGNKIPVLILGTLRTIQESSGRVGRRGYQPEIVGFGFQVISLNEVGKPIVVKSDELASGTRPIMDQDGMRYTGIEPDERGNEHDVPLRISWGEMINAGRKDDVWIRSLTEGRRVGAELHRVSVPTPELVAPPVPRKPTPIPSPVPVVAADDMKPFRMLAREFKNAMNRNDEVGAHEKFIAILKLFNTQEKSLDADVKVLVKAMIAGMRTMLPKLAPAPSPVLPGKEWKVLKQSAGWMQALLAVLMAGPLSKKVIAAFEETEGPPTVPLPKDRVARTHVVIDLSFLAKVTAHTDASKKDEWSQVVSRSEEFKQLAGQIQAVAGNDVVFDIISPYSDKDTQEIFALTNVDLKPGQYNKLFPDMGIAETVDAIVAQESPKGVVREEIEKRILFLLTKPWAGHYKVSEHKDKNYRILIGDETTALGKMVYSGLVLVDAILSSKPDQFIPLLKDWYNRNGLPIPEDIDLSSGANGIYNIPADIQTKQGMGDYLLNTTKYSEEAKIRA